MTSNPQQSAPISDASEGFKASSVDDRDILDHLQRLKQTPYALALFLVFSILLELLVFNYRYVFSSLPENPNGSSMAYKPTVSLPYHDQLQRNALVLSREQNQAIIKDLDIIASNVQIKTSSVDQFNLDVHIALKLDPNGSYVPVGHKKFNPDHKTQNAPILHFDVPEQHIYGIELTFNGRTPFIVIIDKIQFNANEQLFFSWTRVLLSFLLLSSILLIRRYSLHLLKFDEQERKYRIGNYVVISIGLAMSCFTFYAINPVTTKVTGFDFLGDGVLAYTNAEHQILLDRPQTQEEISNSDAYVQLMDAFLKGQLNIDVYVDPRMATLKNVYDFSERTDAGVRFTWDRPYYQGKYYVYFGVAPIFMLHAPLYFLTGKMPSLAFGTFVLSLMAVASILWAYRTIARALFISPNAFVYYLGQLAALSSGLIWFVQMGMSFYYLPYLTTMTWIALYVVGIFAQLTEISDTKKRLYLVLAGISVPMIVMSRPLSLLFAIALSVPAIILIYKRNYHSFKAFALDSLYCLVPVVLGAIFVMWYNYARFDSITEFGANYQITREDVSSNPVSFNLIDLLNSMYYYIFEPITFTNYFPFVFPSLEVFLTNGRDLYQTDRIALFAMPIMWLLPIVPVAIRILDKQMKQEGGDDQKVVAHWKLIEVTTYATLATVALVGLLMFLSAGVSGRYCSDLLVPASLVAFMALLLVSDLKTHDMQERVIYWFVVFLILKTIAIGFFITFSYDANNPLLLANQFNDMNPYLVVLFHQIFMPFAF